MPVVAVAGGTGDFGRAIVEALTATQKHMIWIVSRQANNASDGPPVIQTDYSSEGDLSKALGEKKVEVVICTFIMDNDAVCDAEQMLIRAAESCPSIKRFVPSEFNVEYEVADDVLPYAEKKYHIEARRELEKTKTLEYTYIYPGMFMDYFGQPKVASHLRPLCFFIDPTHNLAVLPGDGEAKMSMTFTTDAARFVALALDLDRWPQIMCTAVSCVTLNELVAMVEKSTGQTMHVEYQSVEDILARRGIDLPTNMEIAKNYPDRFGIAELRALIADLEAGVALGAYDLSKVGNQWKLLDSVEGKFLPPRNIEDVIEQAWGHHRSQA